MLKIKRLLSLVLALTVIVSTLNIISLTKVFATNEVPDYNISTMTKLEPMASAGGCCKGISNFPSSNPTFNETTKSWIYPAAGDCGEALYGWDPIPETYVYTMNVHVDNADLLAQGWYGIRFVVRRGTGGSQWVYVLKDGTVIVTDETTGGLGVQMGNAGALVAGNDYNFEVYSAPDLIQVKINGIVMIKSDVPTGHEVTSPTETSYKLMGLGVTLSNIAIYSFGGISDYNLAQYTAIKPSGFANDGAGLVYDSVTESYTGITTTLQGYPALFNYSSAVNLSDTYVFTTDVTFNDVSPIASSYPGGIRINFRANDTKQLSTRILNNGDINVNAGYESDANVGIATGKVSAPANGTTYKFEVYTSPTYIRVKINDLVVCEGQVDSGYQIATPNPANGTMIAMQMYDKPGVIIKNVAIYDMKQFENSDQNLTYDLSKLAKIEPSATAGGSVPGISNFPAFNPVYNSGNKSWTYDGTTIGTTANLGYDGVFPETYVYSGKFKINSIPAGSMGWYGLRFSYREGSLGYTADNPANSYSIMITMDGSVYFNNTGFANAKTDAIAIGKEYVFEIYTSASYVQVKLNGAVVAKGEIPEANKMPSPIRTSITDYGVNYTFSEHALYKIEKIPVITAITLPEGISDKYTVDTGVIAEGIDLPMVLTSQVDGKTVQIKNVVWSSANYDSTTEGNYNFKPIVRAPEGYALSNIVTLPTITVSVKNSDGTEFKVPDYDVSFLSPIVSSSVDVSDGITSSYDVASMSWNFSGSSNFPTQINFTDLLPRAYVYTAKISVLNISQSIDNAGLYFTFREGIDGYDLAQSITLLRDGTMCFNNTGLANINIDPIENGNVYAFEIYSSPRYVQVKLNGQILAEGAINIDRQIGIGVRTSVKHVGVNYILSDMTVYDMAGIIDDIGLPYDVIMWIDAKTDPDNVVDDYSVTADFLLEQSNYANDTNYNNGNNANTGDNTLPIVINIIFVLLVGILSIILYRRKSLFE